MAKKRNRKAEIHLTERALLDIAEIEAYSVEQFGRKVADRYLGKVESALSRIADNIELLRNEPDLHPWLRFYRVEKHLLVCDCESTDATFVLTLVHATMDIPSRLAELEPSLKAEMESLHRKLRRNN